MTDTIDSGVKREIDRALSLLDLAEAREHDELADAPGIVNPADRPWRETARAAQIAPEIGVWDREWYLRGSRRSGKTFAGGNQLADLILANPPGEWGVVAPTFGDARDTCIESMKSGLLKALGARTAPGGVILDKGPYVKGWNRSQGQLYLTNGSVVFCDGADDGALRIQGKGLSGAWLDEIGLWVKWQTAYDESIRYAVTETPAKLIITGTPKSNMPARILVKRLLDNDRVAKSFLRIDANIDNLDAGAVADLMEMKGTRLGRQEIGGELLEDADGALWTFEILDTCHIDKIPDDIELIRVVVAIDPATTAGEGSDETGIIVVALGNDGRGYVLADLSGRYSPNGWAAKAVAAYHDYRADRIVGEHNNGGDMVGNTVKTVDADVAYSQVWATRGKTLRAEPVAAAYEQGRVSHVGAIEQWAMLESQMTQCVPGQSQEHDDHLDACVYGLTEIGLVGAGMTWDEVYSASSGEEKDKKASEADPDKKNPDDDNPWADAYAG